MRVAPPGKFESQRVLRAGELFIDREPESVAFKNALAAQRRRLDNPTGSDDVDDRRNVLVFYGVGGVGKSTLSERLEAWVKNRLPLVNGWGVRPSTSVDATIRVDLHGSHGQLDVVGAVTAIRLQLGRLRRRWPIFDLAFAAYWAASHPGQPYPAHVQSDQFAGAVDDTITDFLQDLGGLILDEGVPGTPIGLGVRGLRRAVQIVQHRQLRDVAFKSYDGYADFLSRCINEPSPSEPRLDLVSDLAGLLAFELSQWEGSCPMVVVFVDTCERLSLDWRRVGERHLNQIVHAMPNVLFVITGRNMLDWHKYERTNLHAVGPQIWPGLVPGTTSEPRQHLVGKLSPEDTRRVIVRGRQMFGLRLSDEVVDELVIASGGLPEYLDLAREVATTIKRNSDAEVTVSDVSGSLSDLVMRVLDDVPADEQRALRAAALFAYFDTGLIAAAGGVDDGAAARAVERPMIDSVALDAYPYRMHDEIRAALRSAAVTVVGGWSASDWTRAATLAVREIRNRYTRAVKEEDDAGAVAALGLAVQLACDQEIEVESAGSPNYADWLVEACALGPSIAGLRPYVPAVSKTSYGQAIVDFVLAKTSELPSAERRLLLRSIFDSDHPLSLVAGRHLAYNLRNNVRLDEALVVFDDLISRRPSQLHYYQRALTLGTARRFQDAVESLDGVSDVGRASLRATFDMSHGHVSRWLELKPGQVANLRQKGHRREYLEARANLYLWTALVRGEIDLQKLDGHLVDVEFIRHESSIKDTLCALALALGPHNAASGPIVDRLLMFDKETSSSGLGFRSALVRGTRALVLRDEVALRQLHREVSDRSARRTRFWIPVEFLLDMVGLPLEPAQPTQWLEEEGLVRARWQEVLRSYAARADSGPESASGLPNEPA